MQQHQGTEKTRGGAGADLKPGSLLIPAGRQGATNAVPTSVEDFAELSLPSVVQTISTPGRSQDDKLLSRTASWIWNAYRKNISVSMGCLVSMTGAFGVSTAVAALLDRMMQPSLTTTLLTLGASFLTFYGTFLPQLVYKDRPEFLDQQQRFSLKKTLAKAIEYIGMVLAQEALTTPLRIGAMAELMESWKMSTTSANLISFAVVNLLFSFGMLPPIRQGLKDLMQHIRKSGKGTIPV